MSLNQYTQEQLKEMSWIEIAFEVLNGNKQPATFKEIVDEITKALDLSEEEVKTRIAQFYTDLNIDGRFMALGENRWGLRVWYPVDQTEEDAVTQAKPKKKKAKKVVDEDDDLDIEDYDELDDEDVDFDDLEEAEDDFDDSEEEDEDEDLEEADDFEEEEDLLDEEEEFEELDDEEEDPESDEEEDF